MPNLRSIDGVFDEMERVYREDDADLDPDLKRVVRSVAILAGVVETILRGR